ncbi:hypothetical protein SUGI_0007780, partial [Cryptomeria japonica]
IWLLKSWWSFRILQDPRLKGINPASFSLGMTGRGENRTFIFKVGLSFGEN